VNTMMNVNEQTICVEQFAFKREQTNEALNAARNSHVDLPRCGVGDVISFTEKGFRTLYAKTLRFRRKEDERSDLIAIRRTC
jgi:hypothetical protein